MRPKINKEVWRRLSQDNSTVNETEKFMESISEIFSQDANRHMDWNVSPEYEVDLRVEDLLWSPINGLVAEASQDEEILEFKDRLLSLIQETTRGVKSLSDDFWEKNTFKLENLIEDFSYAVLPEEEM